MTKRIVMLVASEPDSDPRIDWEARYAPDCFETIVMGACCLPLKGPLREARSRYTVVRRPRNGRGCAGFLGAAGRLLVPGPLRLLLAVLALPFAILIAGLELFRRGVKGLIGKSAAYEALRQSGRFLLSIVGLRIPISFFRHVVISSAALWRGLAEACPDEATIVHCNDLDTLLVGVMAKWAYGCRLVYDCHEFLPHAWPDATRWNRWLLTRYEAWLIRWADSVITVNPLLAREIMRAYGGIQVQSVPNAEPLPDGMDRLPGDAESDRGTAARPLKFLFQGGFGVGRGIEELIRAWLAIDPREAVLLLRGNDHAHKSNCIKLAAALGLKDVGVFFPPPVSEDRLIDAAAAADVGVIPYKPTIVNFRCCCPNKLSQYMQAGLPIMAGNTAFVRQVLDESGAGVCYDPSDPESIAATVRRLVADAALRRRCRHHGARFVRETFHWQLQSRPLYEAYTRLLDTPEVPDDELAGQSL